MIVSTGEGVIASAGEGVGTVTSTVSEAISPMLPFLQPVQSTAAFSASKIQITLFNIKTISFALFFSPQFYA